MKDKHLSVQMGRAPTYLGVMKKQNPKMYAVLKDIGVSAYEARTANARNELARIYYELEAIDNGFVRFYDAAPKLFPHKHDVKRTIERGAFSFANILISLRIVEKWESIIERYDNEFKKDQ